jgi:SAM-dependent methyltransferase
VDPCYGRWSAFLHDLWSADSTGVRSVLDVCCGTGLMASELVALGYRVAGVDASAPMLARARRLLGPDVVLVRDTLPDLSIDGSFDAAVSTFDGLNYLTPAELRSTFVALAGRIRPGGWLVFDLHTDAMMDFTVANGEVHGEADGHRFTITSVVDVPARTCDSRVEITRIDDDDGFSEHHRQYFLSDEQVRGALSGAGFGEVAITDEYTRAPVDGSTLRATWVARRAMTPVG